MQNLTENQQKVLEAVQNGASNPAEVAQKSGLAKSSITAVVNSLIKKELILKSEEGVLSIPAEPTTETPTEIAHQVDENPNVGNSSDTRIKVLIPYLKSEVAGEELRYALRSWEQNFKEDFQVVVIGDREDWFSPEIVHIPHEPHLVKEQCNCPAPSMIRNPQADVTHKLFTAIASGIIKGNFILSNDDIFLLGETYLADIQILKAFGSLHAAGAEGGLYRQNVQNSLKALTENKLPTHKYGTHTPMYINAEKLIEVIEKYNALEKGHLLTSLYFNEAYPHARPIQVDGGKRDQILASVYRPDVEPALLDAVFANRKFMNCNSRGWKSVENHLKKHFPTASRFEI